MLPQTRVGQSENIIRWIQHIVLACPYWCKWIIIIITIIIIIIIIITIIIIIIITTNVKLLFVCRLSTKWNNHFTFTSVYWEKLRFLKSIAVSSWQFFYLSCYSYPEFPIAALQGSNKVYSSNVHLARRALQSLNLEDFTSQQCPQWSHFMRRSQRAAFLGLTDSEYQDLPNPPFTTDITF